MLRFFYVSLFFLPKVLFAEASTPAQPSALEQFFPFIILGLIFYFLLIRPQQKRHRKHTDFLSQIKRGDEVLTSSGIFGRIEGLTEQFVILEVAEGVRVCVLKSQINSFVSDRGERVSPTKRGTS